MANVTYETARHVPGQAAGTVFRRIISAVEAGMAGLLEELAEARREQQLRRSTRGLSRHLLRDVGLDRDAS
ncbi:MAG: hypothetical protein ACYTF6_14895 [Planctomycetota bacterium]|jgi:uncharacterized protein YjiS (DUF1127 family)